MSAKRDMIKGQQKEVERNYASFQELLPELMKTIPGKYVVMHDRKIVATLPTFAEANHTGRMLYGDDVYSVQEVTETPVDLGWFSHVQPVA